VQAYRRAGETLAAFETRLTSVLDRVHNYGRYFFLTPRFDDFNGTQPVEMILACMPLYDRWIREFRICGLMPFSDRRGNGIARIPSLRAWAKAFLDANPERPSRYDYWGSATIDIVTVLKNKLQQNVEMTVLSSDEKEFLLDILDHAPSTGTEPPDMAGAYRSYKDQYAARWRALGVDTDTDRLSSQIREEGGDPHHAQYIDRYKAIQCAAHVRIVSDLHWNDGHKDVGLSTKTGGSHWVLPDGRKVATDIVCVKLTDRNGMVIGALDRWDTIQVVDVFSNGPNAKPGWHFDRSKDTPPNPLGLNRDKKRPWAEPPKP
jgi:hypothetical protein